MRVGDDQLAFLVRPTCRFANAEADDPIVTGSVTYAATHGLADGFELSEEQVEVFGRQGALLQVHPFVVSTSRPCASAAASCRTRADPSSPTSPRGVRGRASRRWDVEPPWRWLSGAKHGREGN
jgi:hypothetical protein